jgi:uncharacterized RDD family membrane protein YckC
MIVHQVVSTEKVPIRYRVAGLGSRFLAWLADFGLMAVLAFAGALLSMVLEIGRAGLGPAVLSLVVFVLMWGYFLLFEWLWQGQTPGKRLVGLRVIQWRGTGISFAQAAIRNLLRFVDALPFCYAVGFVVAASNRENRRLGDFAADTLVVHVEHQPRLIRAMHDTGAADAVPERTRLGMLRQRVNQLGREEKQTLLDLCLRRDQLQVGERARLFRATGQFLQKRLEVAVEEYESDEKFVLQLAALLGEQ